MMLPPPCFTVRMAFPGFKASSFFLQMMVIMSRQFSFSFIRLQEKLFSAWTNFTGDNDTLLPALARIFTRCSGVFVWFVLGLINTFRTKACSSLGRKTRLFPEWSDGWMLMVFLFACNCLNGWMWQLQASGNCTQQWTRLVKIHNCLPDILADFFWIFSWCHLRKQCVWRVP